MRDPIAYEHLATAVVQAPGLDGSIQDAALTEILGNTDEPIIKAQYEAMLAKRKREPLALSRSWTAFRDIMERITIDFAIFTLHLRAFASRAGCGKYGHEQIPSLRWRNRRRQSAIWRWFDGMPGSSLLGKWLQMKCPRSTGGTSSSVISRPLRKPH
jgi:hypothetical protein